MENKKVNKILKNRIQIVEESVNENELLWGISSIILDELFRTIKTNKKDSKSMRSVKK